MTPAQARDVLQQELAYTLHCPPRRRFPTAPVMVLNMDQQWVADLVEMQRTDETTRACATCWRWWTSCPGTLGCDPWNARRAPRWSKPSRALWPKDVAPRPCRPTRAKNSIMPPSNGGCSKKASAIFPPRATPKLPSLNASIGPWKRACTATSRPLTPLGTWTSSNPWWPNTTPTCIAVSAWPRKTSIPPTKRRCGTGCTGSKHGNGAAPSKWGTWCVWPNTSNLSGKAICPNGRKKSSRSDGSSRVPSWPTRWKNSTAHPSEAPFTSRICKKWRWPTINSGGWKKYLSDGAARSWSVGKGGLGSTTVGSKRHEHLRDIAQ